MPVTVDASSSNGQQRALEIPPLMEGVLRPHQVDALQFLWRRLVLDGVLSTAARTFSSTIEQRTRLFQEVFGVILGHSMGLGKTLTSLTFVLLLQAQVTLMAMKRERLREQQQQQQQRSGGQSPSSAAALRDVCCPALRVLVLCPRSCVLHWQSSVAEWFQPHYAGGVRLPLLVPSAMGLSAASSRAGGKTLDDVLVQFYQRGGLLLLGYEEYQRILHYAQAHYRSHTTTTWPRVWSLLDRIRLRLPLTHEVRLLDMLEAADLVVLDEAHRLRRSSSNLVTALGRHLRCVQLRLALTGTPLQNHLEEYNTMQSIVTGRELDTQLFHRHFIAPIELGQCVDSSYAQFTEMQRCVAALRNYFADSTHHCGPEVLASTLPPRREFVFFFRLSAAQEAAYRAMLRRMGQQVGQSERAESVLQLHHLSSHICLHPALEELEKESTGSPTTASAALGGDRDEDSDGAGEFAAASPLLPAGADRRLDLADSPKLSFAVHLTVHIVRWLREKVIIFSQYLSHLRLMAELLAQEGIAAPALTGASSDAERRRCIDELQHSAECRVLLCSVRAGGVGIKLTAANHCILLDVSWNPADDTQATYRLYRYGQQRPVNIYRLATWGTSEHVVFAYALQKAWLQKKITDVSDPRRQQRHQTRSYYRYPCSIPLPDGTPALKASDHGAAADATPTAQRALAEERRRVFALEVCDTQCPVAAAVLAQHPAAEAAHLATVIPQSMLLRHNDEDVIRERARQFEREAMRKHAAVPAPLQLSRSRAPQSQREALSLLEACEPELVDAARHAAHVVLTHALRVQSDGAAHRSRHRSGSDTVSEVRQLDAALCSQLQPLVASRLEQRPAPRVLAETLLWCYQAGAARLAGTVLHGGAFLKLRTFLTSRIPASGRHRPRDAPLPTRSPLEEALLFSPLSLLRAMSAVEAAYVATELGCDRPLLGCCMMEGLRLLWWRDGVPALSAAALRALAALLGAAAGEEDDEEDSEEGDSATVQRGRASGVEEADVAEALLHPVLDALTECLEEQWPPFEGLALPPQHLQIDREEMRMERAFNAAARSHADGFLPIAEVAELLRLPRYRQGHHAYGCARCQQLLLHRLDATHLSCPSCHFNAEFEIRADARTQQHATLYQLSVVANLLDAFSITRSFAVSFAPAACADVSAALREVRSSQAVLQFVRHAMSEGVQLLLKEYPPLLVRLLSIQLGTGDDVERLGRLLWANGRLAAQKGMREHLRQRLSRAYADFVHPSTLSQLAAMPLMFITTALHFFARHEALAYAHELLVEDCATPHRKLLRFACDALVKVLYVERLLLHCREKPQPAVPAKAAAGGMAGAAARGQRAAHPSADARDGSADADDDVVSLRDLLMSASSSSSSSYSGGRAGGRAASPSSSSPYSIASDDDEGERDTQAGAFAATKPREVYSVSSSRSGSASSADADSGEDGTSASRSRSSSFHSVYASDRESFPDCSRSSSEASDAMAGGADRQLDATGTWLEALTQNDAEATAPTREDLESEAVLQQRSAQYWIAFCEVYGTHSAETLTVYVENDTGEMTALPPPPLPLWVAQVAHTTLVGMRVTEVIDLFLKKLLDLSQKVRLIV